MDAIFLHEHEQFSELIRIVADRDGIDPVLVEKDYWIMHVLWGLKQQGYDFALKGGTSLSKGYRIIDRFSEDIDIYIKPPTAAYNVNENPKNTKDSAVESRRKFYDWLAQNVQVPGIVTVQRDTDFDDKEHYRSGGIRLLYNSTTGSLDGVKDGILLEAGFSQVAPNNPLSISSWAYDYAATITGLALIDNRAVDIQCYHPGYTFIEKVQTIIRVYRQEQEDGVQRKNYMRQYYDIYCLLGNEDVNSFIGTSAYREHKKSWIKGKDAVVAIQDNPAFRLTDKNMLKDFRARYEATSALYYKGQVPFTAIVKRIRENLGRL